MDIELIDLSDYKPNDKKYIKALRLMDRVKVDYITDRHISFTVKNEGEHNVIYFKEKPVEKWQCDCKWYALHSSPCSHIIAVNLAIKEKIIRL